MFRCLKFRDLDQYMLHQTSNKLVQQQQLKTVDDYKSTLHIQPDTIIMVYQLHFLSWAIYQSTNPFKGYKLRKKTSSDRN